VGLVVSAYRGGACDHSTVVSQSYLRAGVSVLLGLIVLGEQRSATVLIGLTVTNVGVALSNWPLERQGKTESLN